MSNLPVLVKGEFDRLNKYNLFKASLVVLLFWVAIAWFFEGDELRVVLPLIFMVDSSVMAILLTGATMFYEKQEHTMNSIMVSPVTEDEFLLTKAIVNTLNSLLTVVVLGAVLYFLKGVTLNYVLLVPAVIVISVVHTYIGIWLCYQAKTFTAVLVNMIIYMFVFLGPSILADIGVISAKVSAYFILLPPEASGILIDAAVADVALWRILVGYGYLISLAFVLYRFVVKPAFGAYVMRETGV